MGSKRAENRMLIRRVLLFFSLSPLHSWSLTLSRSLTHPHKDFFFLYIYIFCYAPKFPFVSKKKGTEEEEDEGRKKKKQFSWFPFFRLRWWMFFFFLFSFFLLLLFVFFSPFSQSSMSVKFNCVSVCWNARDGSDSNHNNDYVNTNNKLGRHDVHPLPSGPDVPTRLTNIRWVLL